jgi:hypothetical protein
MRIGKPETLSSALRILADWIDIQTGCGVPGGDPNDQVQMDLRNWADTLEKLLSAIDVKDMATIQQAREEL